MPPLAASIVDTIGCTPLLDASRLIAHEGLSGRLLIKLEYLNPGHSKKDRVARAIVLEARADGSLQPGQPVVELTSGNTGTGLALVCAALGHPFVAVMSRGNTPERARMMRALGAEVVLVDQVPGAVVGEVSGADLALVEQEAQRLTKDRGAFRADQFSLYGSVAAHEYGTGPEIWHQSGGHVDVLVDFVGSAGSLIGLARHFKSVDPRVRCYAVEPDTAAPLAGVPVTNAAHPIQGGGYARADLPLYDPAVVDGFLQVSGAETRAAARLTARTEGVFGGFSTGANVAAALRLLAGSERGATIVALACDSGLKYLSTDLY